MRIKFYMKFLSTGEYLRSREEKKNPSSSVVFRLCSKTSLSGKTCVDVFLSIDSFARRRKKNNNAKRGN